MVLCRVADPAGFVFRCRMQGCGSDRICVKVSYVMLRIRLNLCLGVLCRVADPGGFVFRCLMQGCESGWICV